MTLAEKQQLMIRDLILIEDPQERLAVVVDRARRRPPLSVGERSEAHRVPGCVSAAWIVGGQRGGRCHFRSDADSPLVRGLLTLLDDLYHGATPAEIAAHDPEALWTQTGLARLLTPTRRHGLRSAGDRIRALAAAPPASGPG